MCTRDRAETLDRCLTSMGRLRVPSGVEWELLVVDNGCTDHTPDVLSRHRVELPLRVAHEPRGGLSHARNRAVSAASGDYILWTDDDAEVDPEWLAAYCSAFARWPDAILFGGPITPRFEGHPPRWLRLSLSRTEGYFAARDFGREWLPLEAPELLPYGCNYAVRTAEQRRFPYDPELGRRPERLGFSGEEVEVMQAMLSSGGRGWWVPAAHVRHVIPPERQTLRHLRERSYGDAIYQMRWSLKNRPVRRFATLRSGVRAVALEAMYRLSRVLLPPQCWVRMMLHAGAAWGAFAVHRGRAE